MAATSPAERQEVLTDLVTVAIRDLVAAWRRGSLLDGVDFAELMRGVFPDLAVTYSEVAAALAAAWFEASSPTSAYAAVTATAPPVERLAGSADWALGAKGDEALGRMSGALQRSVFDGARKTTLVNVARDPGAKWVRHARADACSFCRLLATRHSKRRFWYSSNTAALDVVGRSGRPRGKRAVGATRYHDHCRCIAVEVRAGQEYAPPDYVQAWDDEYAKAHANAGSGDPKKILSAWRQQGVR